MKTAYLTKEDINHLNFPSAWIQCFIPSTRNFTNSIKANKSAAKGAIQTEYSNLPVEDRELCLKILDILLEFRFALPDQIKAILNLDYCNTNHFDDLLAFLFELGIVYQFTYCADKNTLSQGVPEDAILFYCLGKGANYLIDDEQGDSALIKKIQMKSYDIERTAVTVGKMVMAVDLYIALKISKGKDLTYFAGREIFRFKSPPRANNIYWSAFFKTRKDDFNENEYMFDVICGEHWYRNWVDKIYLQLYPYFAEESYGLSKKWYEYNRQLKTLPFLLLLVKDDAQALEVAKIYHREMWNEGPILFCITMDEFRKGFQTAVLRIYDAENDKLKAVRSKGLRS